jgi:hypothetical protein
MPRFSRGGRLAHRFALVLLALAAPATLVAFCLGGAAAPWIAALAGGAAFPVALIALGGSRGGRLRGLTGPLLFLGVLLALGLSAVLALPNGGPDVFGLPVATAVMIFVLVPVPLILLGAIYAASFDRSVLRPEDLDRIQAAKRSGAAEEY